MITKPVLLIAIAISFMIFIGCSGPKIIPISGNAYMISAYSHFNGQSKKILIIEKANKFAESKGKVAVAISMKEQHPSVGLGGQFEYQFKLVDKDSPEVLGTAQYPERPRSPQYDALMGIETRDLNRLIRENALKVSRDKPFRVVVMPIIQTESQRFVDKGFGAFLTEKITSTLGELAPKIRLYERSRLDAVLKEQSLSNGGLFTETDAKRIGELAPVDFVLTGTYTRTEKIVTINARFIDVISGEVAVGFSGSIPISTEFGSLFAEK